MSDISPEGINVTEVRDNETLNNKEKEKKKKEDNNVKPIELQPQEIEKKTKTLYLPSSGIETVSKTEGGSSVKYVHGNVNGKRFEVPCNQVVEVEPEIYEALQPLLKAQSLK